MIKAIVFDIGGVVMIRGKLRHLSEHISNATGMNLEFVDKLVHKYWDIWKLDGIKEEQFYNSIIKDLGVKADRKKIMIDESKRNYPDTKMVSMIKKLRKKYLTVALTNNVREWFEDAIVNYDFMWLFNHIITSYETKKAKPDKAIYDIMLQKTGLKADECVFVDDQAENLPVPKKMGMKVIHYRNYKQCFEELRNLGVEI
jgi:epoxide hydrolase-like predicted phosphatase